MVADAEAAAPDSADVEMPLSAAQPARTARHSTPRSSRSLGSAAHADDPAPLESRSAASKLRVLLADGDRLVREGCITLLREDGHLVTATDSGAEALDLLRRRTFDVALVDLDLTPVSGIEVLRAFREIARETLVVMMTADATVENRIQARSEGAWEYLPKPFTATHLRVLLGHAAHVLASGARDGVLARSNATPESSLTEPLGSSRAFRQALAAARQVAGTEASVILVGESGTGKEVLARYIHAHSRRARASFVPLNCAALPEPLLESELFGHVRGAFTGADRDKPGLLETADKGCLFLDEVTEMAPGIQAKLLRVLQDGRVRRVGSEDENTHVDIRMISATNQDPREAVTEGRLRQDLFFRLWVFPIMLPPLRDRAEDVGPLATAFLDRFWTRYHPSQAVPALANDAIDALSIRRWPGNVRELQNLMERIAITAKPDQQLHADDLPSEQDVQLATRVAIDSMSSLMTAPLHSARQQLLHDFEQSYLEHLVARAGKNLSRAARLAHIDRKTLYRMMHRHGLHYADEAEVSE